MALLAYPLFRDVTATIGRLLRLQGSFQAAQLARRIGAAWGDRTTLHYAVARIVRPLADWGVLHPPGAHGAYTGSAPLPAAPTPLTLWLLEATLCSSGARMPLHDLLRAPASSPFRSRSPRASSPARAASSLISTAPTSP